MKYIIKENATAGEGKCGCKRKSFMPEAGLLELMAKLV